MIRLIVVGASGYIGGHIKKLAEKSPSLFEVIGTQHPFREKGLITFDMVNDNIKKIVPARFKNKKRTFAIICAAIRQMDYIKEHPEETANVNVKATIKLIKSLSDAQIKPVFISTSAVFDGKKGAYEENDKPNPICEYGKQKLIVENYIRKNHPDALILRFDKIIGTDPLDDHLFSEWNRNLKKRQTIKCIKGQIFSPTLVDDVARASLLAVIYNLSGTYHVANPERISRYDLAKKFVKATGFKGIRIKEIDYKTLKLKDARPLKTNMIIDKYMTDTRGGFKFSNTDECIKKYLENNS